MFATDPEHALVPLFAKEKYKNKIKQVGTGIFIDFWSQPFLFTAAHVTDNLRHAELLVPVHGGIEPIEGYVAYIDLPPEISRHEDHVDIAYYRLSSKFATLMCTYFRPLPQSRSELLTSSLGLGVCSICGYPSSKYKYYQGKHKSETATYRGVAANEHIYNELGLSPEENIIVHFHRNRAVYPDTLSKMNPISTVGVSGGGIFAWPFGQELSHDWTLPKLVGIFHSYKKASGLMIGTNLIPLLAAIQLGEMKGFDGVQ